MTRSDSGGLQDIVERIGHELEGERLQVIEHAFRCLDRAVLRDDIVDLANVDLVDQERLVGFDGRVEKVSDRVGPFFVVEQGEDRP